jgi:hypothetical protein
LSVRKSNIKHHPLTGCSLLGADRSVHLCMPSSRPVVLYRTTRSPSSPAGFSWRKCVHLLCAGTVQFFLKKINGQAVINWWYYD